MKLADLISEPSVTAFKLEDGTEGFVRLLTCDQVMRYHALIRARASAAITGQMTAEARDWLLMLVRWGICHSDGRPLIASDDDFDKLKNSAQSPATFKRIDLLCLEVMKHNELGSFAEKKTT